MVQYRKATAEDLEIIWDYQITANPGEEAWIRWKKQFIDDNNSGAAATFVAVVDDVPVGEGTLLFSPACRAIRGRLELADGKNVTNINALRIRKAYEGRGYISNLVKFMEDYAISHGYSRVTIGAEAVESRNLGIYLHWGYDQFVMSEGEDMELTLYYAKDIKKQ